MRARCFCTSYSNPDATMPGLESFLIFSSLIRIFRIINCLNGDNFNGSRWGNFYRSTDWRHDEIHKQPEWTHWMPLPEPPKEISNGLEIIKKRIESDHDLQKIYEEEKNKLKPVIKRRYC